MKQRTRDSNNHLNQDAYMTDEIPKITTSTTRNSFSRHLQTGPTILDLEGTSSIKQKRGSRDSGGTDSAYNAYCIDAQREWLNRSRQHLPMVVRNSAEKIKHTFSELKPNEKSRSALRSLMSEQSFESTTSTNIKETFNKLIATKRLAAPNELNLPKSIQIDTMSSRSVSAL